MYDIIVRHSSCISPAGIAATVAVFGTLHLLALTSDSRPAKAFLALGF
jgi:hypothetical protein